MKKIFTYNKKDRNDISNTHTDIAHNQLLRYAGVKKYNGNYKIINLDNGRIIVRATSEKKAN